MSFAERCKEIKLIEWLSSNNSAKDYSLSVLSKLLDPQGCLIDLNVSNEQNRRLLDLLKIVIERLSNSDEKSAKRHSLVLTCLLSTIKTGYRVIKRIIDKDYSLNSASNLEKKDDALSSLHFYNSVLDSGLYSREGETHEILLDVLKSLIQIGKIRKYFMEPCCFIMIKYFVDKTTINLPVVQRSKSVKFILNEGVTDYNILSVLAVLQRTYDDLEWNLILPEDWEYPLVNECNFLKIVNLLESSPKTNSRVHPCWNAIVNDTLGYQNISKGFISFTRMWTALDAPLFRTSTERKIIAMHLIADIVTSGSSVEIASTLSTNACSTLVNALCGPRDVSYITAAAVISKIVEVTEKKLETLPAIVAKFSNVKFRDVFDLVAGPGIHKSISNNLTQESVINHLRLLRDSFLLEKNPYIKDSNNDIRLIYLENMYELTKVNTQAIGDDIIEECLIFVTTHALFKPLITVVSQDSRSNYPIVPLSEGVRNKAFGILTRIFKSLLSKNRMSQKGLSFFILKIIENIRYLEKNSEVTFYDEKNQHLLKISDKNHELVQTLSKNENSQNGILSSKINALVNLCSWLQVLLYFESDITSDLLEDLDKCCPLLINSPLLDSFRDHETTDRNIRPIDLLIDVLLSCLAEPYNFIRSLVKGVLLNFMEEVDLPAVELVLSAIKNSNFGKEDCDMKLDENEESREFSSEVEDEDNEDSVELEGDIININGKRATPDLGVASDIIISSFHDEDFNLMGKELSKLSKKICVKEVTSDTNKEQILRFRICAVDLLDVILKKKSSCILKFEIIKPLLSTLFSLSKHPDEQLVVHHLIRIIEIEYKNTKTLPLVPLNDCVEILKYIHDRTLLISNIAMIRACSEVSIFVVKVAKFSSKSNSNLNIKSIDNYLNESEVSSTICEIYKNTLLKFLSRGKLKLGPYFFENFIKRCQESSIQLLLPLLNAIISKEMTNYRLICAYRIFETILRSLPQRQGAEVTSIIKSLGQEFISTVQEKLDSNCESTEKGQPGHKNSLKKLVIRCVRLLKSKFKVITSNYSKKECAVELSG